MTKEILIINPENYNERILDPIKTISDGADKVGFVSLNKTFDSVTQLLSKRNLDLQKFFFIDTLSATFFPDDKNENVTFINSLGYMKSTIQLLDNIKKLINEKNINTIVFDSFSSLMVYRGEKEALEWTNNLLSFIEEKNVSIYLFVLNSDKDKGAIKQIEMRVDKSSIV